MDMIVPGGLIDDGMEAALSVWLYADGETVPAGALVAEIMVEKTSYELRAPASGKLRILAGVDEAVRTGQTIARIE